MKLRNKLAMMLTATMITTCVPMVTFANDTSIDKTLILRKDDPVTTGDQYLTFKVDIDVTSPDAMEVYLEGDNIEFEKELFTEWARYEAGEHGSTIEPSDEYTETVDGTEVTYVKRFTMGNYGEDTQASATADDGEILVERTGDNKLKLTLKGSYAGIDIFRLPLVYKVTDTGEATLEIKSGDGRIEETTLTLSKGEVGDKDLVAKITGTDIISIEGKGKLGEIEFSEIAGDQLSGRVIKITLDSSDIEFVEDQEGSDDDESDDSKFTVSSSLGLISNVDADHVKFVRSEEDHTIGYLIFDENSEWLGSSPGKVKIEGLNVEDSDGDVSTGELEATIELMDFAAMDAFEMENGDFLNPDIQGEESNLTTDAKKFNYFIGHKGDFTGRYGLTWDDIDTADVSDKMSEVDDVIAKITENELGISVETDVDVIGGKWDEDDNKVKIKITDPTREFLQDNGKLTLTLEGAIFAPMTSELGKDAIEENADEDEFFTKIESDKIEDDLEDEEDFIKIEESNPNVAEVELDGLDESSSELEFSFYVVGNPGYNGDITLTADGSKWDEPMTATVGTVTQPVEVNLIQQIVLVENEKAPAMGMVTITETADKMFSADDVIVFGVEDLDIEDAEVTADNGMQVDSKISDGHLLIQVQRRSNDPATITISDIKFDGTGYIAFGEYDAYIGGQGIHAANTFINFEESKSSRLVGKPDDPDDWNENGDDYFNGEVNLEEFSEDIDEIFAVAFSLDNFVVSTLPMIPDLNPPGSTLPTPEIMPEPEPTPQPEDVAGPDGNYGLADTYIEISGGRAYVNGKEIKVNTEPKNIDGTTMVGVADLATLLGIPRDQEFGNSLTYHQETDGTGVVTIRLEDRRIIEVRTGSNKINISDYNSLTGTYVSIGNLSPAAQAARIIDGRMFVPMRQIGESLGFDVSWNSATKTAIFTNM
ncbi:hypothetical protein AN644_04465 [Candidatus Epulonipiscium fishelsonii]|nr:hypothetical protein AN644_04465 [Epulopiscium sp. SCG-C06WGA-EpuloA1]